MSNSEGDEENNNDVGSDFGSEISYSPKNRRFEQMNDWNIISVDELNKAIVVRATSSLSSTSSSLLYRETKCEVDQDENGKFISEIVVNRNKEEESSLGSDSSLCSDASLDSGFDYPNDLGEHASNCLTETTILDKPLNWVSIFRRMKSYCSFQRKK